MKCMHCFIRETTDLSGYCKMCRVWLEWLRRTS